MVFGALYALAPRTNHQLLRVAPQNTAGDGHDILCTGAGRYLNKRALENLHRPFMDAAAVS